MVLSQVHMSALRAILSPGEILDVSSPEYLLHTETWSAQKNRHPAWVLRPSTLLALQNTVQYLCQEDEIDFAVRSGGIGSSSASDIVLSMAAFDGFEFDPNSETVIVGVGQTWGDVDRKIEESAPGYAGLFSLITLPIFCETDVTRQIFEVVGARTPYVGVGGSILCDISWLSSEFGLGSDPRNLLDAQVVLTDGCTLWASTEPDLLWALRGGGGNFASESSPVSSRLDH